MSLVLLVWFADVSTRLAGLLFFTGTCAALGSFLLAALLVELKLKLWSAVVVGSLGLFMVFFAAILPSKQGLYQIAAAYGAVETVQYLQQSNDAKRVAGKSIQAIEKMLDDAIKVDKK